MADEEGLKWVLCAARLRESVGRDVLGMIGWKGEGRTGCGDEAEVVRDCGVVDEGVGDHGG